MEEQKFQMDFAGRPLVIEVGKLGKTGQRCRTGTVW